MPVRFPAESTEGLCGSFKNKLHVLDVALALRDTHEDTSCVNELQALRQDIENVKNLNVGMAANIKMDKMRIEEIRESIKVLIAVKSRLTDMISNLPARLPKPVTAERKPEPTCIKKEASNQNASTKKLGNKSRPVSAPATSQVTDKQANVYYPEIEFLTVDEFNQVPKYLKGRLSYDQINKFLEGMNTAFQMKYKLLKLKKSTMSDATRKKYDNYQLQITKETKGSYFVVDEDLKEYGSLKMDSSARSTLSILRHCGRLQEVHGGRLTRYVYLDNY